MDGIRNIAACIGREIFEDRNTRIVDIVIKRHVEMSFTAAVGFHKPFWSGRNGTVWDIAG